MNGPRLFPVVEASHSASTANLIVRKVEYDVDVDNAEAGGISMYILALNGSPRGRESNTDRMLQPFLAGAREAGATTETIYVTDLKIDDCRGCFSCWTRTPGRCIICDDMPAVLEKMKRADVLVLGTPLYHFGMTARLKRLLERTLPLAEPHIIKRGNHYTHPSRGEFNARMVLIANCGFPDRLHFTALEEHLRQLTKDDPERLLASILCPGGELLRFAGDTFGWYFRALCRAGWELVKYGRLTADTEAALSRELVPPERYTDMANAYWNSQIGGEEVLKDDLQPVARGTDSGAASRADSRPGYIDDSVSGQGGSYRKEPSKENLRPPLLPRNCKEAVLGMPSAFNPAAAEGLKAVLQINLTGEGGGAYHLVIEDGRCTVHEGKAENATTIITAPADVWLRIARGELDGAAALMQGLYRVAGDFGLMLKMQDLFSGPNSGNAPPTRPPGPLPIPGLAWLSVAFLPWTLNWVGTGLHLTPTLSWGAPAILALLTWLYRSFFNQPTWMDGITALYFLTGGLLALTGTIPTAAAADFSGNLVLGATWLATLATDQPLTAAYSRWSYPAGLATNPLFLRTNAIITAVWGEAFLFMAVIALAMTAMPELKTLWLFLRYLPLVLAGIFTAWFAQWYPRHIAASGHSKLGRTPG